MSATTTLARILDPVIDPAIDLGVFVLTEYWGILLVLVIASALIARFTVFAHLGSKK